MEGEGEGGVEMVVMEEGEEGNMGNIMSHNAIKHNRNMCKFDDREQLSEKEIFVVHTDLSVISFCSFTSDPS